MAGKYMHEGAMVDAYKKLYMLGGPGHERRKAAEKDFDQAVSGAVGGIGNAYSQKLARDKAAMAKLKEQLAAKKAAEAADAEQFDDDVRYIKEGPEGVQKREDIMAGRLLPENPYKAELAAQKADREADNTRIGGVYTPQGLQMAEKEANLNAQDRLMLRSMVQPGLGGSQPTPNQPPNAMDQYQLPAPPPEAQYLPVPNPEESLSTYKGLNPGDSLPRYRGM